MTITINRIDAAFNGKSWNYIAVKELAHFEPPISYGKRALEYLMDGQTVNGLHILADVAPGMCGCYLESVSRAAKLGAAKAEDISGSCTTWEVQNVDDGCPFLVIYFE